MKKIAITIQNFVQYYSIQPLIDELIKTNCVHIYVPTYKIDEGYNNMYNEIYKYLVDNKYTVYRKSNKKEKYKILLEPDNLDNYFDFSYDYRIKYKYFVVSSKPKLLYNPYVNIVFDAILCHSTYERDLLSVYSDTYLVGRLNFIDFKKRENKGKKNLLYLPTYGKFNTSLDIIDKLKELKDKYNIIIKMHHGTNYLKEEKVVKEKIYSVFDKIYDSKVKICDVLKEADVVLSDNSGAIFDALYNQIPVCIYSPQIDDCSYFDLESLQLQLVNKKIIPFTNKVDEIDKIIDVCLSKKNIMLQKKESKKLFPLNKEMYLKSNLDVINKYLNDEVDFNKIALHRILVNNYKELINNNIENINLKNIIYEKDHMISYQNKNEKILKEEIANLKIIIENKKKENEELNNKINILENDYFKIKKIRRRNKK